MLFIIINNIISGIFILIYGNRLGNNGAIYIINRIFIYNIIYILIYIHSILFKGQERRIVLYNWIQDISKNIELSIIIDNITIIMSLLIILISYIIMKYSNWYIKEIRFKGYLYIFLSSMLILVSSRELITLYIGWEWVGISSYLLINYWYNNVYNNKAGIKAIFYNKVGDIAFILLILEVYNIYNNINNNYINYYNRDILCIYIGIAAIAKSAQYIMHPWLGDAMAGPTPVSALLHAATMVTAGIILLSRTLLYNSYIWDYILFIGIITIIFGGITSLCQNDIKKLIAFSTCSQLGYMFILYNNMYSNLFHLFIHAFFKALLFLCAGIIIHYNNNEQDLRRLSLNRDIIYIFLFFASFSLFAFPFTSGYYSKENLILSMPYFPLLYIGSILTLFYSYKLLYKLYYNNIISSYSSIFIYSLYLILSVLLLGTIFLGYYTYTYFYSDIQYLLSSSLLLHVLPLFILITFIPYKLPYDIYSILYIIYTLFNNKSYVDYIINKLSINSFISYYSYYKFLDKGILEFFGPIGIFRLFVNNNIYSLSSYTKINIIFSFIILLIPFIYSWE